ncbi:glycosyltransferase [Sulfobacillus harzensis]|uniref:Glycosyltransferase family 4 protein n=1 Tax=Sulfobacillus harzensis TaxID=2729629 RepID=A0A7Y0L8K1_9FIRM|nr:glycosyltransferase [Sulfobacillus harzensis]NMP24806.1 glycosyltransferase family 4 protein [Sulfobacillus harzensis]
MTRQRVAVVFLDYRPTHEFKDQGMYVRALNLAGYDAFLVTTEKPELADHRPRDFEIVETREEAVLSGAIWDSLAADAVVGINWFSRHFLKAADELMRRDIHLIIKADTDGYASPRIWLRESWRRYLHQSRNGQLSLVGAVRVAGRTLLPAMFDRRLLDVVERSAAVIVETTAAIEHVQRFISYYHRDHLQSRLHLVYNPVDSVFTNHVHVERKRDQMVLVGRWNDSQKNTQNAVRATCEFLRKRPSYEAVITGAGTHFWHNAQCLQHSAVAPRVTIRDHISHTELLDVLVQSQILLSSSFFEGSPLAMAEALCCGTTIVGTPIPATDHFIASGRFGTRAKGFHWRHLVKALETEAYYWEAGLRNAAAVSGYWIPKQRYESISEQLQTLLDACLGKPRDRSPKVVSKYRS